MQRPAEDVPTDPPPIGWKTDRPRGYDAGMDAHLFERPACPDPLCGNPRLDLIQPDRDRPTVLLGVCHACRRWYLIDDNLVSLILGPPLEALASAPASVGG